MRRTIRYLPRHMYTPAGNNSRVSLRIMGTPAGQVGWTTRADDDAPDTVRFVHVR